MVRSEKVIHLVASPRMQAGVVCYVEKGLDDGNEKGDRVQWLPDSSAVRPIPFGGQMKYLLAGPTPLAPQDFRPVMIPRRTIATKVLRDHFRVPPGAREELDDRSKVQRERFDDSTTVGRSSVLAGKLQERESPQHSELVRDMLL